MGLVTLDYGRRCALLCEFIGVLYLVGSIALSIHCLDILAPYLRNDLFWPGFEDLNTSQVITSIINSQLTLSSTGEIDLFSPTTAVLSSPSSFQVSPAYARLVFYRDLTSIEAGIEGLRRLDISLLSFMESPYCWLDMNKQWEMAHTKLRQSRCDRLYKNNGAVHLEAVLRNIDFHGWLVSNAARFNDHIGNSIQEMASGRLWLTQLLEHKVLKVEEEMNVWLSCNLTYFALQYSNRVKLGVEETITIENALGLKKLVRIKSLPSTGALPWTTVMIYCPIECDYIGVPQGQSFIRNTSNFWGDINPSALESFNAGDPLSRINQVIHDEVGPLMSIDMRWIAPPPKLIAAVQSFRSQVLTLISKNSSARAIWATLQSLELTPTPIQWKNVLSFGGNPMCIGGEPLRFPQQSFSFDDTCGSQTPLTISATPMNALFASMAVKIEPTITCLQCLPSEELGCVKQAHSVAQLAKQLASVDSSHFDIGTLDISYLQFTAPIDNTTNISISTQPLLASNWAYFGYMSIYDWAMNEKEVVAFEGDVSIRLMSSAYTPVNSRVSAMKSTLAIYAWYLSAIMSAALALVAAILIIWWVLTLQKGCRWYNFNRIVGSVWLNRTILFVRSTAAMVCLATAPVQIVDNGLLTILTPTPRTPIIASILASETTWLAYICQELIQPVLPSLPSRYTHGNLFLVWLMVWGLDIFFPVEASASIERKCSSKNMATMVYCSSGYIQIGFVYRVIVIAMINITTVLVCSSTIVYISKEECHTNSPLLITSAALCCLWDTIALEKRLNPIISAMCGLITFTSQGVHYTFDTKLWLRIIDHPREISIIFPFDQHVRSSSRPKSNVVIEQLKNIATMQNLGVLVGFTYLGFTLIGNITYLNIAQDTLANDYFWAGFNSTGMHTFIANLVNRQILLAPNQTLQLDYSGFGDQADLYGPDSNIKWGSNSARRQLFQFNTPLQIAIQGLRSMSPSQLPWMFTQYCWLDFKQTWEMATTICRQHRCQKISSNGAVYFESGLRNVVDWSEWDNSWGISFNISVRLDLEASNSGKVWLSNVFSAYRHSIEEEMIYWQQNGITTFELQWQNFKSTGVSNTLLIENALGLQYPLQISYIEGSLHVHQQTSFRLYWSLASDLWATSSNLTSIAQKSLLRGSPRYAFANTSSESLLYENLTLIAPLRSGLVSFRDVIGPFNSVDAIFIQCPDSFLEFFGSTMEALTTILLLNESTQKEFLNLSVPSSTFYAPGILVNDTSALVVGGNIMCGDDNAPYPASVAMFQYFGADIPCFQIVSEQMPITQMQMAFALLAFNWTSPVNEHDFDGICALNAAAMTSCSSVFRMFFDFLQIFASNLGNNTKLAQKAYFDVQTLPVELTQYVMYNGSLPQLFHMNIFDPNDRALGYYSWCLLYDWVTGAREVVSFQGDNGVVNAISHFTLPLALTPDPEQIPISFSFFGRYSSQYITLVIIGVAVLLVINTFIVNGEIEGYNLFMVNRMVGLVWIGRSLLAIRSVTALCLLNTSTLQLIRSGQMIRFISPPLPWYKTILAAAEVNWVVYVLNDFFSCITQQYTSFYAAKSSHLAWLITIIWVFVSTQQHECIIHQECTMINMDFALECTTGVIKIGSVYRMKIALVVAISCVIVCYAFDHWRLPNLPSKDIHVYSLNAQSIYMLRLDSWKYNDQYFLDSTSAIMAGILALRYRNQWYILDIKSWRVHIRPVAVFPTDLEHSFKYLRNALPLHQL